jgi:ABC-type lipoprotein export system ATPase subunit
LEITLDHIIPDYLEKEKVQRSQVWNSPLSFKPHERLHIVAPSGNGKTSFIHFLYGLRKDYSGKVSFDQHEIKSYSPEETATIRSRKVSIIFQDLRLFPDHTVRENIEIKRALDPYGENKVSPMAEALGIASKLDSLVRTCSYGEQQRVAIIRALQQPFELLLMDEPFSHLDDNNRSKAMQLIESECRQRGAMMIFADLQESAHFKYDRLLNL